MVNQISGGFRSRLDSSSSITDNTFIEIFMYLPLTSIYRFRSVSKVWFSLLSDPNFITKWFQFNNKSLPWLQYHTVRLTFPFSDESPFQFRNSYPDLHSRFISRNEHFFSFEFLINEIPLEGAELYLLGSSNGLVLCFSVKNEDYSSEERRYHVYNPLTQKWVSIPLLPRSRGSRFAVSGIFCEFSLSASCCYKVVRIPIFDWPSKIFYVDVFCSDSGEWRNFEVSCDQDVEWFECDNENVVTTLNGVLYWMERSNRMLVYNMNQNNESDGHQCSLIDLPDADISDNEFGTLTSRILGESEGRICYASTRVTNRKIIVSVWVLDDDNWQMLHKDISIDKTLTEIYSLIGDVGKVRILGFNPQDSNIVLLGRKHWVWEFNIETGSFEELDHSSLLTNRHMNVTGKMVLPFVLKVMPTKFSPSSWKTVLRWTEQVPEHTGMDGPVDDEYSWRKYGMNYVFGARYPRSYYRCKLQRCLALKQVQRSEEDPSTFVVTYRRRHTCIQFSNRHDQLDEKRQRRSLDTVINFQTGCHVKTEESGEEKVVLKSPSLSFPSAPLPTPTLSIERDKNSSSMTTDNHSLHLTNEYKVILVFHLMDRSLLILFNYQVVLIKTVIIFLLIVEIISIRCDVQRTSLSF